MTNSHIIKNGGNGPILIQLPELVQPYVWVKLKDYYIANIFRQVSIGKVKGSETDTVHIQSERF